MPSKNYSTDRQKWVAWGLLAYACLLPLRRLYFLPLVSSRLQLTEVCFLLFAPLALHDLPIRLPARVIFPLLTYLVYLIALSLATAMGDTPPDWLELLGRYYLLAVLALFAAYVSRTGQRGQQKIIAAWTVGLYVMGSFTYLGYALYLAGTLTPLVSYYEDYPYFGTVYRAVGTAGGATALVALSILPCTYAYRLWRSVGTPPWILLFLFPLLLLTFSKEMLLLLLALVIVEPWFSKRLVLRGAVLLGLTVIYGLTTHLLIQPVSAELTDQVYDSERVVWEATDYRIVETSYTALKRAALSVAADHPLIGVGADGFPDQLPAKKREGVYPAHLPEYIPHSTWFGTLAEVGILGLTALIFFVVGLGKLAVDNVRGTGGTTDLCLLAYLSALLVGSLSMDLLHLRFFWVPVAMVLGASLHYQSRQRAL